MTMPPPERPSDPSYPGGAHPRPPARGFELPGRPPEGFPAQPPSGPANGGWVPPAMRPVPPGRSPKTSHTLLVVLVCGVVAVLVVGIAAFIFNRSDERFIPKPEGKKSTLASSFYEVFSNAAKKQIINTKSIQESAGSETRVNVTYDYKTNALSYGRDSNTNEKSGSIQMRCVDGKLYYYFPKTGWQLSPGKGRIACEPTMRTDEIGDGINTAGLSVEQAGKFIKNFVRIKDSLMSRSAL